MNLFGLSGSQKLKSSWNYISRSQIWRLVPSGESRIVGEERDAGSKAVSFFCLDLQSGKPLWRDKAFDQEWWSGIEAVGEGVMLLHGFATPELPGHRGITAVHIDRGHEIWKAPDLVFVGLHGTNVIASRGEVAGTSVVELDLFSGVVVREHGDALPVRHAAPADDRVVTLRPAMNEPGPATAVGPVEILEAAPLRAVVWYESAGSGESRRFRSLMAVTDSRSGEEVLRETLQAGGVARVPQVVFVLDGFLCYLKERQTLVGIRIPSGTER